MDDLEITIASITVNNNDKKRDWDLEILEGVKQNIEKPEIYPNYEPAEWEITDEDCKYLLQPKKYRSHIDVDKEKYNPFQTGNAFYKSPQDLLNQSRQTNIGDETRAWLNDATEMKSATSKGPNASRNRKVELNIANPMNISVQSNRSRSKNLYDPRKNSKERKPDNNQSGKFIIKLILQNSSKISIMQLTKAIQL